MYKQGEHAQPTFSFDFGRTLTNLGSSEMNVYHEENLGGVLKLFIDWVCGPRSETLTHF